MSIQPFDPTLADLPVRRLPLDRVVDLLAAAPTHAPDRVEAYASAMAAGQRFPPIAVIRLAGRYIVADGHKRLLAYKTFGEPDIVVEVWTMWRFLRDQWEQARAHARKHRAIVYGLFRNPRESRRLWLSGLAHWWRVAKALGGRLSMRRRSA